jgi:hypothetical protein
VELYLYALIQLYRMNRHNFAFNIRGLCLDVLSIFVYVFFFVFLRTYI